VILGKKLVK
jgi:hypothetical protein